MHFCALATVIGGTILSYYPPSSANPYLSEPYSRLLHGRTTKTSPIPTLTIMWSQMVAPKTANQFKPNHFVPLIAKHKPCVTFHDLTATDDSMASCHIDLAGSSLKSHSDQDTHDSSQHAHDSDKDAYNSDKDAYDSDQDADDSDQDTHDSSQDAHDTDQDAYDSDQDADDSDQDACDSDTNPFQDIPDD